MPWWAWVLIGVAVLALLSAVLWTIYGHRRTERLRAAFGPEYERTMRTAGDRRGAESELEARQERRAELDIRPLTPAARDRYAEAWRVAQARFVDAPPDAVQQADRLVIEVMRERGYPMEDFEARAAVVSVDHPQLVEDYRAAHRISQSNDRGEAETEDLRLAMVHYRSLFEELLETSERPWEEQQEPERAREGYQETG